MKLATRDDGTLTMKYTTSIVDIYCHHATPAEGEKHPVTKWVMCNRLATTTRWDWRFGGDREPAIVWFGTPYCEECAIRIDNLEADARAEARAS
jgi:hypothetical protein